MLSMSKLLSIISISAVTAFGASNDDVLRFFKNQISKNPQIELVSSKVAKRFSVSELKGWEAVLVDIEIKMKDHNQTRKGNELIFVNGDFMAPNLINLKTGADLKFTSTPPLDKSYYDKSRLIYGNEKSKNKIIIFSDPLCPFCMDYVPDAIDAIKKEPSKYALYFYHLPLEQIHPAALSLIKMILAAEKKGVKDVVYKVYKAHFNAREKDDLKLLAEFNKQIGTNLTIEDINTKEIIKHIQEDIKRAREAFVGGTPSVYVNLKKTDKREFWK